MINNSRKKVMPVFSGLLFFCIALLGCSNASVPANGDNNKVDASDVDLYVTTSNQSMLFKKVPILFSTKDNMSPNTIQLNPNTVYQEMDGFGAAMTGSTCYNLMKMSPQDRSKLLNETFDPKDGMGYSYIRVTIAASDFSLSEYTYCDKQGIENFALQSEDKNYVIPIVKEILAINPKIKIMASPWTCPKWMKVNNLVDKKPFDSWTSGQLNPDYYQDYATYFVKYVQAMSAEGIPISSLTVQNEPLNRGNSVSLFMTWQEQRDFIKSALGPAFRSAGIKSKIIVFDHNYNYDDMPDQKGYPSNIYNDADAAQYIDGAGYHAYGGNKAELNRVHDLNPDKNLYFTEMSIGEWGYSFANDLMWNFAEVCIGTINNWSKAVIVWNFMLDKNHGPNRPGGCTNCYGAIDINSDYKTMTKNSHYYTISHLSKVIKPGAKRIGTTGYVASGLYYIAFLNTDGTYAVVLQNETNNNMSITIADGKHSFAYVVPAKAIASYKWNK